MVCSLRRGASAGTGVVKPEKRPSTKWTLLFKLEALFLCDRIFWCTALPFSFSSRPSCRSLVRYTPTDSLDIPRAMLTAFLPPRCVPMFPVRYKIKEELDAGRSDPIVFVDQIPPGKRYTCMIGGRRHRTHDIKETRVEGLKSIYACMQALRLVWHCVTPTGWPRRLSQPQTHLRRPSRQSSVRSDLRDRVLIVSPSCLIICFHMYVQPRTPAGATSPQRHSPAQVSGMSSWHHTL
jgi:hypothetical protein